jgi:two-component system cell cycle response regulator
MLDLCLAHGFSLAKLQARCALLGFTEADRELAGQFSREVLAPAAEELVDSLFERLSTSKEVQAIVSDQYSVEHLKKVLKGHLLTLGEGYDTLPYCEERLRVGLAHARAGVPLGLYVGSYAILQQLIADRLDESQARRFAGFAHRITSLDIALVSEAYYVRRVRVLEAEMDILRRREKQLRRRAETDLLTGLPNRDAVLADLRRALRTLRRDAVPFCAVMVDLDHFKQVNDSFGHPRGDLVLQEVAKRMKASIRSFDSIGRYGGEEFLVLLNRIEPSQGVAIAERMREHVGATPIELDGETIPMTISAGIARAHSDEPETELIRRADEALYGAKQAGRNRVVVHDAGLETSDCDEATVD